LCRWLEESFEIASVHDVEEDEVGEQKGACDGGLSGLGHSQEQEGDESDGDVRLKEFVTLSRVTAISSIASKARWSRSQVRWDRSVGILLSLEGTRPDYLDLMWTRLFPRLAAYTAYR
jgi:hypothetical protein